MGKINYAKIEEINKIKDDLYTSMYEKIGDLKIEGYITKEPVSFNEKKTGEYKVFRFNDIWGELWDCCWFHFTADLTKEMQKAEQLFLLIDISGEGCIFDNKGYSLRGITNVTSTFDRRYGEPGKRVYELSAFKEVNKIDLWMDAGCNDLFGNYSEHPVIREANIALQHSYIRDLYYDYEFLYDYIVSVGPEDLTSKKIMNLLFSISKEIKSCESFKDNKEVLINLHRTITKFCSELEEINKISISAIGHGHIDLAWLWPIRETKRKAIRTFSSVLYNMERYRDYKYGISQGQLLQWVRENDPALYENIKQKVKEGRIEIQSGMWVEPDCNMPSGESLIRQIYYGKEFALKEFGVDVRVLWLPDVFGFSAALPQIMKKCELDYLMTIKLSWNEHNEFPYSTFWWSGIDGTKVLVHMPPEGTYNSAAAPNSIINTLNNFKEADVSNEVLLVYGIGDGGGGPGAEHLERLERANKFFALPKVNQVTSQDFFTKLEREVTESNVPFPSWHGELYLEKHQGVLTSMAKMKKWNRTLERKLRMTEMILGLDCFFNQIVYPEEVEKIWKEVLLYQFHDILPGSSISRVYEEALERYEILDFEIDELLLKQGQADDYFNSLSWCRTEWVEESNRLVEVSCPSLGYGTILRVSEVESIEFSNQSLRNSIENRTMENQYLKVELNHQGFICSLFDKINNREVCAENKYINRLVAYKDFGDAWDIPINYEHEIKEEPLLLKMDFFQSNAYVKCVQKYQLGQSKIELEMILWDNKPYVEVRNIVNWLEKGWLLKTESEVEVLSDYAAYDIQYGYIKRSNSNNTSWEQAKFECGHQKWVDYSNYGYGVSLINDCKYGAIVKENKMSLSLLRNTSYPNGYGDEGRHEFNYLIYPHAGDCNKGKVNRLSYEFNNPLKRVKKLSGFNKAALLEIKEENIVVDYIKKPEKGEGIVIRLYESFGMSSKTHIHLNFDFATVYESNLLEKRERLITTRRNEIELNFDSFEIKTLIIK